MSIMRISKGKDPFARVDKRILRDPRLSWKAKGILAYLIGHPNNWEVRCNDIVQRSTDGISAIYSAMKELREMGYAKLEVIRENGRIVSKQWVVTDVPNSGFLSKANLSKENIAGSKNNSYRVEKEGGAAAEDRGRPAPHGFNLEEPKRSEEPITHFSAPVVIFAQFSIKRKYHIVEVLSSGKVIYAQGAQVGGWSRQKLTRWEGYYRGLAQRSKPDHIEKVVKWYVQQNPKDEWLPHCHTFPRFCECFEKIEKAMKRAQSQKNNGKHPTEAKSRIRVNGVWMENDED